MAGRGFAGLPTVVRGALWTAAIVAPGLLGWYVGHTFFHQGFGGVYGAYATLCFLWGLTEAKIRMLVGQAILSFVLVVPVVYVLAVAGHLTLLLLHLAPFTVKAFFLTSLVGALGGSGGSVLLTLKGTLEKGAEKPQEDLGEFFLIGLSFRIPTAFLVACLVDLPTTPWARVTLGVLWGVVAAGSGLLYTTLVDREPAKEAFVHVMFVEILLLLGLVLGVLDGLTDRPVLYETLELAPPAALGCVTAYLVAWLVAWVRSAVRRSPSGGAVRRPASGPLPVTTGLPEQE